MLARLRSLSSQGPPPALGDLPDGELAVLAGHGTAAERTGAFDALYGRYVNTVHGYAFRQLGNREAAEDATSEIFDNVARSLAGYRLMAGKPFRAWLFTIAHHVVTDHRARQMRDYRRHQPLDPDVLDPAPSPSDQAAASDEGAWIRATLVILPQRERQVIEFDLAGLKTAEIANVLGLSSGAVHTARCRALDRLQTHLGVTDDASEKRHVIES
jgi:RNA polymerase sigma-70 factor (ECF subfamily)